MPTRTAAVRIALFYAAAGALWIFSSGYLLHAVVQDRHTAAMWENLKGWFFVAVTAALVFVLLDRYFAAIRRAAHQLAESEARLHLVGDNLPDSYMFQYTRDADSTSRFSYMSAGVRRVHGVEAEAVMADAMLLLGQMDASIVPAFLEAEARSARDLTDFAMDLTGTHANGKRFCVLAQSRPWKSVTGQVHWDGFTVDVTERRAETQRYQELQAQFHQAQKMEAIGQLAGGVAHDFNNILTSIMMQTELGAMGGAPESEVRESLEQIRADAERAAKLTRQLLLFSRREIMQSKDVDLNDVVTHVGKMLQRIIGEDVQLSLSLSKDAVLARADVGMLEQVLLNLAVNARDAMPSGGTLSLSTDTVAADADFARAHPDATAGERYAMFSMSDTGVGIAADVLPHIFEPFFTTKGPGKGTGLGLATAFGIVKQHEGWVHVESDGVRGTTFKVFLPARSERAKEPGSTRLTPSGGSGTILFVEDDQAVRAVTERVLVRTGYKVISAESGEAALLAFEEAKGKVDLLLTDVVMPGMDGLELARRLVLAQPRLKVIYTSGYSVDLAGRALDLAPGQAFVQKPALPRELLAVVHQTLGAPTP
jgi:signal transduction histidine kinase/CheY-like chemotaxis protein